MFAWFSANLINLLLILALTFLVFVLVRGLIRDRRAGKSPCGGSCAGCVACGMGASCCSCGQKPE